MLPQSPQVARRSGAGTGAYQATARRRDALRQGIKALLDGAEKYMRSSDDEILNQGSMKQAVVSTLLFVSDVYTHYKFTFIVFNFKT